MSLETAAAAFTAEISGSSTPSNSGGEAAAPTEVMFSHLDDHEDDVVAGGDDLPNEGELTADEIAAQEIEGRDPDADDEVDPDADDEVDPDADDEDEDEDDAKDDVLYKVTVDGEEVEVPLREALDGYIRQETFARRLNKLDTAAKGLEQHAVTLMADRKSVIQTLTQLEEEIQAIVPQEPNWDELFAADKSPGAEKTRKLQKDYEALNNKLGELRAKKQETQDAITRQEQQQFNKYVEEEKQKTLADNKHWSDPEKGEANMKRDLSSMKRTALDAGFGEDEVNNVFDSRMIKILLKASKYDRMTAKRPTPVQRDKRPANSGAGSNRTAPKGAARAAKQLRRTGSVQDAGALFTQLIQG